MSYFALFWLDDRYQLSALSLFRISVSQLCLVSCEGGHDLHDHPRLATEVYSLVGLCLPSP